MKFAPAYATERLDGDDSRSLNYREEMVSPSSIRYGNGRGDYLHFNLGPIFPLTGWIKPLTSPDLRWITLLALEKCTISYVDLVNLSEIKNLGGLILDRITIQSSNGSLDKRGVTDAIVRAWGDAALESGAFPVLRVLGFRRHSSLTRNVIRYISDLPALSLLLMDECDGGPWSDDKKGGLIMPEDVQDKVFVPWQTDALKGMFGWRRLKSLALYRHLSGDDNMISGDWRGALKAGFTMGAKYNRSKVDIDGLRLHDPPVLSYAVADNPRGAIFSRFFDHGHLPYCLLRDEKSAAEQELRKGCSSNAPAARELSEKGDVKAMASAAEVEAQGNRRTLNGLEAESLSQIGATKPSASAREQGGQRRRRASSELESEEPSKKRVVKASKWNSVGNSFLDFGI